MELSFQVLPSSASVADNVNRRVLLEAIDGFTYLPAHKVLVCKRHGYAVRNLKTHLTEYHSHPLHIRRAILTEFKGVDIVPPELAVTPEPYGLPIVPLGAAKSGYLCTDNTGCNFITVCRKRVAQHCNKAHGWKSTSDERQRWRQVRVQTFSAMPGRQRYFIVNCANEQNEQQEVDLPVDLQSDVDQIMQEFNELEHQHEKALEKADEMVVKTDLTGWWKRTGWAEHLKGSDLKRLSRAARLPDKHDTTLRKVRELVEALVEQSVKGLMTLPLELRRWLKSVQIAEVSQRPMGRLKNESSQNVYATYWVRLICYCLRVLQSEDGSEEQEHIDEFWDVEGLDSGDESEYDNKEGDQGEDKANTEGPRREKAQDRNDMYDARRLFPWRVGQKDLAKRLLRSIESDKSTEEQMAAVLRLSETFIFQKVYANAFRSPLLHFLAVLGIDEEHNRLRTGNDYSYILAGVVYCVRAIALESLLPGEQRETQGEIEFEAFLEQRKEYLADGTMSVMSNMISLLAYGKLIALNHGNSGSIFWEKGDRVMRLHSSRIVMDKFREMVKKAITDAEQLLWSDLMWEANRFEVDLDELMDDVTFRKRGAYFVNNDRNGLQKAWKWMVKRAKQTKVGRRLRKNKQWHSRRAFEYLRKVDQFLKLLMFGVHVTSGQPARGPEITSLRFKNGYLQDRNVFVVDGIVMTVTRYHKSQSQWDVPKVVPRFLPWRLGQLMVVYLTYVQPFVERLSVTVGYGCGWGEYIWADANGPWETRTLTAVLKRRTGRDLEVELGTLDYRHVAIGIGRKFVGDEFARGYQEEIGEVEEPEIETDDPLEQSAGRGTAVGVNRYAVSTDIVKHLSQRNIDTFRPLSESWHRFLGLATRKGDDGRRKRVAEAASSKTPSSKRTKTPMKTTAFFDGLATPCMSSMSSMGSKGAGPLSSSPMPATNSRRNVAELTLLPSSPPVMPAAPLEAGRVGLAQRERAIRKALRMADGVEIRYKSAQQQEALERIMNGKDSALAVVLPTGGGKTLLFTAPACLDAAGVTIVVVPYRQLINETVNDAKAAGIECIEWTHLVEDPAAMVVVSADKMNDRFFGYGSLLASKGLLRRVFVDEVHLSVTAHSWRKRLVEMARVQTLGVPVIMLTATLPIHMESDLEVTMATRASLEWIRACTARKTTKYMVRAKVKDGDLQREAVKVCRKQLGLLKHGSKMVVYCRMKSECEELASELRCSFFYAGAVSNEDVLEKWKTEGGCVVATSALGTGVNYPGIEMVVHAGMPYGLIDFAQESGRAGRGGEEVDSLILVEKSWEARERAKRQAKRQGWTRDEMEMLKFVNTDGCRRLIMAEYFDEAEPTDCITGEMARCDRCGSGVTDWERSQKCMSEEEGLLIDTLDQIANGCAACWIMVAMTGTGDWLHGSSECNEEHVRAGAGGGFVDMSERAYDVFRKQIRYSDGRTCFRCGISQKLCNTREEEQGQCQWPRIAAPVLRAAMASTIGRNIIRQAGYDGEMGDWNGYALWLAQPHRLRQWKELVSNSMVVITQFLMYCRQEMGGETEETESAEEDVPDCWETRENEGEGVEQSDDSWLVGGDDDLVAAGEADAGGETTTTTIHCGPDDEARRMGAVLDVEELKALVDGWKRLCVICKIKGRIARGHTHWTKCDGVQAEREQVEEAVRVLRGVQFKQFSQCKWCHRSQAMCELWRRGVDRNNRVFFAKQPGRDCVYGEWLLEATAAMLAFRKDGLSKWKMQDPSLKRLQEEIGSKHRRREVEFSGLFAYFYKWA